MNGIKLLTEPKAERIVALDGFGSGSPKECGELKVGLCHRTLDNGGRKIIPVTEIYISVNGNIFTISPSMAEILAIQLNTLAQDAKE